MIFFLTLITTLVTVRSCNDADLAKSLLFCQRSYSNVSCSMSMCIVQSYVNTKCDKENNNQQAFTKSSNDVYFCNTSMRLLNCSVKQMDSARDCMDVEPCWHSPNIPCTRNCYRTFTECLIRMSCNRDDTMGGILKPVDVCQKFRVPCSNAPDAVPHGVMCQESLLLDFDNSTYSQQESGTSKQSTTHDFVPLYIGVSVGFVVIILAVILFCVWRVRSQVHVSASNTSPKRFQHKNGLDETSRLSPVILSSQYCPADDPPTLVMKIQGADELDKVVDMVKNGRCQQGKLIGRGANGTVFLTILDDGSLIAMKRMSIQEGSKEDADRNLRELALVTKLNHPNIVRYFYAAHTEDPPSLDIFMEFVQGGSLGNLVKRVDEPLNEAIVRRYARQILEGLKYLHGEGVIHRDLKADNVLLSDTGCVKISDFGTAKYVAEAEAKATAIVGSPYWMAPEVMQGKYSVKADIWSFGVLLYELLNNGRVPYPAFESAWDAVYAIGSRQVEPTIPDSLASRAPEACEVMKQCFVVEPELRPGASQLLTHPWLAEV